MVIKSESEVAQAEAANKILWSNPEFADQYKNNEHFTGEYAYDLLLQIGLQAQPQDSTIHFLDLACGTGIVSKQALAILSGSNHDLSKVKFTCSDLSTKMLNIFRSRIIAEDWSIKDSIEAVEADMTNTKLPSDTYTHLACNFGPGLAPNPDMTLRESFRMLQPGGVAGWTAWQRIGWRADFETAFDEMRANAGKKCSDGTGTKEDKLVSTLPTMLPSEDIMAKFAGLDLPQLRQNGVPESDLPRWDQDWFWKREIEKAGFGDVKVTLIGRTMHVSRQEAAKNLKPMLGIISTFWTEEQRKKFEGVNLAERLDQWFDKRFNGADVKDGTITWNDWNAIVMTGRKPQ